MDELVKQALAKWPDVPDCTGWLALDARGRWRIGEAKAGPRQPITHAATIAYINRNYVARGRYWVLQNGPQQVFVELEYTPLVWRLIPQAADDASDHASPGWNLVAHNGLVATPTAFWLDDAGRFLAEARTESAEPRIGVIHDHDTAMVTELLHDDAGLALDDERLSQLTSATLVDLDPARSVAQLRWATTSDALLLPVHRIAADQVASRFGFEPQPSIALRVDVDTRR